MSRSALAKATTSQTLSLERWAPSHGGEKERERETDRTHAAVSIRINMHINSFGMPIHTHSHTRFELKTKQKVLNVENIFKITEMNCHTFKCQMECSFFPWLIYTLWDLFLNI